MKNQFLDRTIKDGLNGAGRRIEPGGYRPLPAGVTPEPALAAIASPWLNDYLTFAGRWSPRSCPNFHEACAVWLLSMIAARRIRFYFGGPHYTSLYLALVGRSSLDAKTTAVRIALETLDHLGLAGLLLPDRFAPEDFLGTLTDAGAKQYDLLDDEEQARVKLRTGFAAQRGWYYQPLDIDLAAMAAEDSHQAALRATLNALDNSPELYEIVTETYGLESVERPYLAILAELTPGVLRSVAGPRARLWRNGFLARFLFATPPSADISTAFFPDGKRLLPATIIDPLRRWHERLGLPQVRERGGNPAGSTTLELVRPAPVTTYELAGEVLEALYAYEKALWRMMTHFQTGDLILSYGLLPERALRVAALLASLEGGEDVRLRHWARAQQLVEGWRASLHRLYEWLELNQ